MNLIYLVLLLATHQTRNPTSGCYLNKVIIKNMLPIQSYKIMYQRRLQEKGYPTPSMIPQVVSTSTQSFRSALPTLTHTRDRHLTTLPTTTMTTTQTTEKRKISVNITCGTIAVNHLQAVILGNDAPEHSYPWQVYIRGSTQFCGGVLISSQFVITAAHCPANDITILLGTKNVRVHSPNAVIRSADKVIRHERFDKFNNDIALIKMNEEVEFNDYIRPVCLPVNDYNFEKGENCHLTGWGMTNFKENIYPSVLQEAGVDVISNDDCYDLWLFNNREIGPGHLCTSIDTEEPTGGCSGDSGGPISCLINSTYYVAAIASRVEHGCDKKFLPDVYSRVSFYREWIKKTMSENS